MEVSGWGSLWVVVLLLKMVPADPPSQTHYILSQFKASFDQAMTNCSPGVLMTTTTQEEVQKVIELINKLVPSQEDFTVWTGLRKTKDGCVNPLLPLRGFKWVENITAETEIQTWVEEPKLTCTEVLCAALKLQVVQSRVKGLLPVTCKAQYHYLCKLPEKEPDSRLATTRPAAADPEPRPATPEPFKPEPVPPEPHPPSPGPNTKPRNSSRPGLTSDSCQNPAEIQTNRFRIRALSLDPDNDTWIQMECWSNLKLDLFCSGRPAVWRLGDGSPVDFSSICLCEEGFQRNASGHCVDVNECIRKPCRHTCLNTEGSYRCVCDADVASSCRNGASAERSSLILTLVSLLLLQACRYQLQHQQY